MTTSLTIKCQVETPIIPNSQANRVTYRRYHKINMDTLRNDLSNCSFVSCPGVPDGFKSAVVTTLMKKSSLSKDDLKNYRPVSGLSFISKLVERVCLTTE